MASGTGRRAAWVGLVAALACDLDASSVAVEGDAIEARDLEENGFRLNGFRLNGFRLNGFRLNGFRLNGDEGSSDFIELQSISLASGGVSAHSWLVDSDLHVETTTGAVLSGAQLVGAVLHFGLVEGAAGTYKNRKLRISGVSPLSPGSDVLSYDFLIKDEAGPWQPLCVDDFGVSTRAILIGDAWDPATGSRISPRPSDVVTLACRGAALAKCVEWGYLPWELPEYHQTCTRAVRADYCGDGTPHTIDGVMIHVLDEIGIQDVEPSSSYLVEAEWGTDGATCLNIGYTRLFEPAVACARASCGEPFASGGLIQTGVVSL